MSRVPALLAVLLLALVPRGAFAASPTLFRLFLTDGTTVVSFGEYARVGDDVVFSMAAGGTNDAPRLHLVTLPAAKVDWARTERYGEAARAAHYAATRGDDDFLQLSNEVARALNDIALDTDRSRALALAQRARDVLAQWPKDHYHYRESEVRDIQLIIDSAIANLRGEPSAQFDLSLVATTAERVREPLQDAPTPQMQLTQLLRVADLVSRAADRMALLHGALALLEETAATLPPAEVSALRHSLDDRIAHEVEVDRRYSRLSQRLTAEAGRAAASARTADVEKVLAKVAVEDRKLGEERPETVQALRAAIQARLDDARRLRLLRDQWLVRRAAYRDYQRRVGTQIVQLVKAQPLLDAIRRLDGPAPNRLVSLKARLAGGADRLQRLEVPVEMQPAHELLVGAWRFAENAAAARYDAVTTGNVTTAWTASSAAAGALMLLSRAQEDIRILLELPKLQ